MAAFAERRRSRLTMLPFLTNRIDRRMLLTGSMVLYVAGHLASAFAPGFSALLAIRLVMVASAAVFTPQAAAAVGLFVRPERRSSAVALVFVGWSLASAFGVPVVFTNFDNEIVFGRLRVELISETLVRLFYQSILPDCPTHGKHGFVFVRCWR